MNTKEKPSTNSSDPVEHPAATGVGQVGAGEPGGVGEVARQQRHHARREEGDQAGDHRDRDRRAAASRCRRGWRTSRRGPSGDHDPAPFCDVAHQVDQRLLARHLAEDAGGDPALLVEDDRARDGARVQGAVEGEQGAAGRVEERGVGHVVAALEGQPLRRGWSPWCSPRRRRRRRWPAHARRRPGCGASLRQGGHQEPQTLSTTTLPAYDDRSSCLPASVSPDTSPGFLRSSTASRVMMPGPVDVALVAGVGRGAAARRRPHP